MSNNKKRKLKNNNEKTLENKDETLFINNFEKSVFSDLILESSDGVQFHVSSIIMGLHSVWFKNYLNNIKIEEKNITIKVKKNKYVLNMWLSRFHNVIDRELIENKKENYINFDDIVIDCLELYIKYNMPSWFKELSYYLINQNIYSKNYIKKLFDIDDPNFYALQSYIIKNILNGNIDNIYLKYIPNNKIIDISQQLINELNNKNNELNNKNNENNEIIRKIRVAINLPCLCPNGVDYRQIYYNIKKIIE